MESLSVTAVKYWCWWAAGDDEWFLFAQQKGENEGKKVLKDFFHSSREHQETTKSTRTWNFFRLIRGDQIRTGFFFYYLFIKQELNICITSLGKKTLNLLFWQQQQNQHLANEHVFISWTDCFSESHQHYHHYHQYCYWCCSKQNCSNPSKTASSLRFDHWLWTFGRTRTCEYAHSD